MRSDIRDSQIEELERRVQREGYQRYLRRLVLKRVRGFADREVTFDFPVTALVGPNGGGKTTILGAAGLMYKAVPPQRFFPRTGSYDDMQGWSIEYELVDRTLSPKSITKTASYTKGWNRKAIDRPVLIFGVSRTVPAVERKELYVIQGTSFEAAREVELTNDVTANSGRILAKELPAFNRIFVDGEGKNTLFTGCTEKGERYSEFHFGSGEASIIRMVAELEAMDTDALVLIEEIENGLHPAATKRLVDYLMDVARRKSCQIVFTTHSNDALTSLPEIAVWTATGGEVSRGKPDIAALRVLKGDVGKELAIFVEDDFAAHMVATAIRFDGYGELGACGIYGMGGAAAARNVHEQHNVNPTRTAPSVCVLDGDQAMSANPDKGVYVLPGSSPEQHVFNHVIGRIDNVAARLTELLHLPATQETRVKEVVRERSLTNRDRHVIWQQIADDLHLAGGAIVRSAFLAIWALECPSEVSTFVDQFRHRLPRRLRAATGSLPVPAQAAPVLA